VEAWRERAGFGLLLGGAAAGYVLAGHVSGLLALMLVVLWLATLAVLLQSNWVRLLGPLFFFDLSRTARRSRFFLLRIYVYFILLLLFCAYISWSSRVQPNLRVDRAVRLSENLFGIFLFANAVFVGLLTPGYVATALTEEKDRNTLEALLATDLTSREIVLSKLGVRLANLLLMLSTGLPIVTAFLVLGGVDAGLALVGYLAVGCFTVTLACLAIHNSVRARRSRDAIVTTYIELGAFVVLTCCLFFAVRRWLPAGAFVLPLGRWSLDFRPLAQAVMAGNPLLVLARVVEYSTLGGRSPRALIDLMVEFVSFHAAASLLLTAIAVWQFRKAFQKQTYGEIVRDRSRYRRLRPRLGNHPLLWKEIFTEAATQRGWLRRWLMGALILACFLPVLVIEWGRVLYAQSDDSAQRAYTEYCTTMGGVVLCVLLVRVIVQAALAFSRERDQQTLDSLLTCPVSVEAIVGSKWLGCLLGVRKLWLWPAAIWGVGVARAGVPVAMIATLVGFWALFAGVGSLFGEWCSLTCRSGLRAILVTLLALGISTSGVLMIPLQAFGAGEISESETGFRIWIFRAQLVTSPPIMLGRIVPDCFGCGPANAQEFWERPMAVAGCVVWLAAGALLWYLLCRRVRARADQEAGLRMERTGVGPKQELNPSPVE
jgi:ABC-type transport system involved in multi-copper enzyme maturation permease subunit